MSDLQNPPSAEDRYAAAVELLTDKPETDKPAEPVVEAKPTPEVQRNADGTFAAPDKTDKPEKKEAVPFEGFDTLTPEAQANIRRLLGERDDFKLRYTRQLGEYRRLVRQGSGQQAQPTRRSGQQAQAGQPLEQARTQVSELPPGSQRTAIQKQLDIWQAHAEKYPDDAAAINQLVQSLRDDLASGINPLAQEVQELRSVVQELRGGFDAVQTERMERQAQESQSILDQEAGDNWRQIAGWEDDNGRPIPPEKRDWHPEFRAWVEGHDPDMQDHLWQTLAHSSPRVAGRVFAEFNRDVFGLEAAPATPNVTQRRAENLRDVAPSSSGKGRPSPALFAPTGSSPEDQFAAAVEAMKQWKQ